MMESMKIVNKHTPFSVIKHYIGFVLILNNYGIR